MALYFKERIDEQKKKEEDPVKDKITFTRPWIIRIPPPNATEEIVFRETFKTCYKFGHETWRMELSMDEIRIGTYFAFYKKYACIWNGSCCFISYNLFYDNEMRFLLYSSPKIQMTEVPNADKFYTPDEFMTKFKEAYGQRKIAKIAIFVELQLPAKNFYRPYDIPGCYLSMNLYEDYPEDIDEDDRFQFLKDGDFVIKCPDGSVSASRLFLIGTSKYMKKHFETSPDDDELVVNHSIDVVKPIIIYLHTRCLKMPKTFDLDYAKRLLNAIYFFELKHEKSFKASIQQLFSKKFVEKYHDFDSILQWASFVSQHSMLWLEILLATVIADKFYFKWQQNFPEDARNSENPLFFALFGGSEIPKIFDRINGIFEESFLTNVILD